MSLTVDSPYFPSGLNSKAMQFPYQEHQGAFLLKFTPQNTMAITTTHARTPLPHTSITEPDFITCTIHCGHKRLLLSYCETASSPPPSTGEKDCVMEEGLSLLEHLRLFCFKSMARNSLTVQHTLRRYSEFYSVVEV